jgi:predicted RNase H-like HicB family nuclease
VFKDETSEGHPIFLARNPALYGCMAQGDTLEEAINNLEEARIDYIYSLLEDNQEIPDPAIDAVMTVDTASPVQITMQGTVQFDPATKADSESVHRKPFYEVMLRT